MVYRRFYGRKRSNFRKNRGYNSGKVKKTFGKVKAVRTLDKDLNTWVTPWENITNAAQYYDMVDNLNTGESKGQTRERAYYRKVKWSGLIKWDIGGTPAYQLRIVIALVDYGFVPTFLVNDNIYGSAIDGIRHIYKDKKYTYSTDKPLLPFKITAKTKGIPIRSNGGVPVGKTLMAIVVSDTVGATTDIVNNSLSIHWSE